VYDRTAYVSAGRRKTFSPSEISPAGPEPLVRGVLALLAPLGRMRGYVPAHA
jgi:hypothetical protein